MKISKKVAAVAIAALAVVGVGTLATVASAGGSDAPTPYTVDLHGITLPSGDTFPEHGHVNLRMTDGATAGIHFDPNNGQPGGAWIGKSHIPWEAFGFKSTDVCVEWVQLSHYNQHWGEGSQAPVGKACKPTPTPDPEPGPQPEPMTGVEVEWFNECTVPADGTRTYYEYTSAWVREYVLIDGEWELGKRVDAPIKETVNVKPDDSCAPDDPEPTPEATPTPESVVEEGEAVEAVGECAGDEWVTVTTVTSWTEVDGERTYGEPVTTETRDYDPTCDPETPACGPIGSCGEVPTDAEPTPVAEKPETPTATPAKSAPAVPTSTGTDTPVLASTGAESAIPLALGALALVGAGALAIRRSRA